MDINLSELTEEQMSKICGAIYRERDRRNESACEKQAKALIEKLPPGFVLGDEEFNVSKKFRAEGFPGETEITFVIQGGGSIHCYAYDDDHLAYSTEDALNWFENLKIQKHTISAVVYSAADYKEHQLRKWVDDLRFMCCHHTSSMTSEVIPNEEA